MVCVYVLHESVDWYGPLDQALTRRGIPHQEIFLGTGSVDLTRRPPEGVFFNRLSATAHTRGHVLAVEYARALLHWLESNGRRIVNSREALELAMSKAALCAALDGFGILTPRTVAAIGLNRLIEAGRLMNGPFLVKPNRSGKGIGIQLFGSADELTVMIDSGELGESSDGVFVVQEYIRARDPFITRCEFVGRELVYALRSTIGGGFNLCPTDACALPEALNADLPRFSVQRGFKDPILQQYQAFMQHHGIEIAAIEFIVDAQGRKFTYDLNINTNYNQEAEQRAGISGMDAMARYLGRELAQLQSPPRLAVGRKSAGQD
ncbi:MAG TPA: alpha-L-glutamate ligase [Alphaproteobacteria bacterium]|nr:alpha-L-glutamate ligase [Alphaproteobacteria bacterium]